MSSTMLLAFIIFIFCLFSPIYSLSVSSNTQSVTNNTISNSLANSLANNLANNLDNDNVANNLIPSGYYMGPKCQYIEKCSKNDMGRLLGWQKYMWWGYLPRPIKTQYTTPNINHNTYLYDDVYNKIMALDNAHILLYYNSEYLVIPFSNANYDTFTNTLYIKQNAVWSRITQPTFYYIRPPATIGVEYNLASISYNIGKPLNMTQIHCVTLLNNKCTEFTTRIIKYDGDKAFKISNIVKTHSQWLESYRKPHINIYYRIRMANACLVFCIISIIIYLVSYYIPHLVLLLKCNDCGDNFIMIVRIMLIFMIIGAIVLGPLSGIPGICMVILTISLMFIHYISHKLFKYINKLCKNIHHSNPIHYIPAMSSKYNPKYNPNDNETYHNKYEIHVPIASNNAKINDTVIYTITSSEHDYTTEHTQYRNNIYSIT